MLPPPALAESLWKGCSVIVRKLAAWLVGCALVAAGVLGGATPARAASVGWIPSDWVSVASGAIGDVRAALGGGAVSVVGASGSAMTQGEYRVAPDGGNHRAGRWEAHPGSDVVRFTFVLESAAGYPGSSWPEEGSWLGQYGGQGSVQLLCSDGAVTPDYEFGQGSGYWSTSSALVASQAWRCSNNGHGALVGLAYIPSDEVWRVYRAFTYRFNAEVPAVTTAVTCRNLSTGSDQVVSETSAGPAAPSPVCPSGWVPVRVRVSQGSSVLSDASITSTALDRYAGYIGDPGGWEWRSGSDPSNCYIQKSADPTMVIALSVSVCSEAHDNGYGEAEEQPDCGADLVCSMVRLVGDTVSGLMRGLSTTANRILEVVRDGFNGVKTGLQSILDKLIEFKEQEAADTGGGPGEGETAGPCTEATCGSKDPSIGGPPDGPGEGWDDLGSKFDPLMDALDDLGHAFNPPATGDCRGPGIPLTVGRPPVYPLDACEQPMAGVASLAKIACGVLLCLGAFMAIVRVVLSSIGMTVDVGQGS